jgi:membrane protease YdiL (CAAX protease family)
VAATALAGHGFTALRRRADSVLPAIAVHWAINGAAATAAGGSIRHPVCMEDGAP